MSVLTHIFQQKPPNSEKVLRRILHEDEVWYWDPTTNVVDKRASKKIKKDKKEKRERKEKEKKEKKEKKGRPAELNGNRKGLTTSDDICWRKAEVNRRSTRREDSTITLGNPAEAIEKTLGIKLNNKNKTKLKTYPLHHSASFTNMFRRSKNSSSSASSSSASTSSASDASDSESESDDSSHTVPQTINKLRLISFRHTKPPSSSSSTTTTTSSATTTSALDSTLSGSTSSSPTSSANNSPITSPRSPTTSPVASPRTALTTARMRLHVGLRRSVHSPTNILSLGPSAPSGPNVQTTNPRIEVTEQGEAVSPIKERPRCPTPLSLDPDASDHEEFELHSIDELTDDSSSEGAGFWVRERMHRPPSSHIPPFFLFSFFPSLLLLSSPLFFPLPFLFFSFLCFALLCIRFSFFVFRFLFFDLRKYSTNSLF